MLDDKALERLIKNVVKAIDSNDSSVLTVASVRWILDNWDLKPRMDFLPRGLVWKESRIPKVEFTEFFQSFNCFEHFVGDVDLNHVLGIINHYVKKDGLTENYLQWIANFRQRCQVVNNVRARIKLKTYNFHIVYKTHHRFYPRETWRHQKYVMRYSARNLEEAMKRFRAEHRDDNHPHFKSYFWFVKRVREFNYVPYFMLNANTIDARLFELLK
jgi:hypothetical protein